ncbi:MAG: hypothetical protein V2B18_20860 [Pseudomonadota bacterium]
MKDPRPYAEFDELITMLRVEGYEHCEGYLFAPIGVVGRYSFLIGVKRYQENESRSLKSQRQSTCPTKRLDTAIAMLHLFKISSLSRAAKRDEFGSSRPQTVITLHTELVRCRWPFRRRLRLRSASRGFSRSPISIPQPCGKGGKGKGPELKLLTRIAVTSTIGGHRNHLTICRAIANP